MRTHLPTPNVSHPIVNQRGQPGTRTLAAVVLAAAVTLAAAAEAASAQDVELGVWAGRSVSNQVTTNVWICAGSDCGEGFSSQSERNAWAFGVDGRFHVVGPFSVRMGASLALKGWGADPNPRVDSRYLEFPVLLQMRLLRYGRASLYLGAGVAPSVLVACRFRGVAVVGTLRVNQSIPCDEPDVLGNFRGPVVHGDIGWVVAPAFRWQTDIGGLWIEPSYTHGRVNIMPDRPGFTTNRDFVVSVGLTRTLGAARRR